VEELDLGGLSPPARGVSGRAARLADVIRRAYPSLPSSGRNQARFTDSGHPPEELALGPALAQGLRESA
jgi:hypothetical protein